MSSEHRRARSDVVRYVREGGGISFDRVAFFTDAVFAVALTLIVVGVGVPAITDGSYHVAPVDGGELLEAGVWDA